MFFLSLTTSRAVKITVIALASDPFYSEMICWPPPEELPHKKFARGSKHAAFRQACGAIDGTLVAAHPPSKIDGHFRDRKNGLSWNVLGVCDLDRRLTFVFAGWEGPANDITIFYQTLRERLLVIPEGYYLLGDAGFVNRHNTLTPFPRTTYHMPQWRAQRRRPATREEVYNHAHSSLRMPIEQVWGIMKGRFKALKYGTQYSPQKQVQIIYALCALQNFMHDHKEECEPVPSDNELLQELDREEGDEAHDEEGEEEDNPMTRKRETIADEIFAASQRPRRTRRRGRRSGRRSET